ncbi:MAG: DUF4129 domain-containing protein [Anaerolineales bacterium]|jgi:hypothetical protein
MTLLMSLRWNERWTSLASHTLLVLMVFCFNLGLVRFGEFIFPAWNSADMLLLLFFVILEAIGSSRLINRESSSLTYRAAEWVVLLTSVKVFTELRLGTAVFAENLSLWSRDFFPSFFTPDLILNLSMAAFTWAVTSLFARNLKDLEGDEIIFGNTGMPVDRRAIHSEVLNRFLMLGLVLAFFAGVMRQTRFPLLNRPPASSGDILFVFIYFLFGLVLLSLTNFASQRASWIAENVTIRSNLTGPWIFYSLVFLGGVTIVAMLLPTRYTLGFLDLLTYILKSLVYFCQLIAAVIVYIFTSFINLLSLLFGKSMAVSTNPNLHSNPNMILNQPQPPVSLPSWWEFAKSLIFWILFTTIIVFAFSQYLQRSRRLAELFLRFPFTKWLVALIGWLQGTFLRGRKEVGMAFQAAMVRIGRRRTPRLKKPIENLISLRRLTPRQRVLFFYHTFIRRAGETGLPRQPWMTPAEYSRSLEEELSIDGDEIGTITDAFNEARYTRHEVKEELATKVKSTWERIRVFLRVKSRQ